MVHKGRVDEAAEKHAHFPNALQRALTFLKAHDFTKMEDGRYEIEGDLLYATVSRYTTKAATACYPEAHRVYVDLQYMVDGEESFGVCPLSPELIEHTPYDVDKDIVFYEKLLPESTFPLTSGDYAVVMPTDVHRPCVAIGAPKPVLKVVVKIALSLFADNPAFVRRR